MVAHSNSPLPLTLLSGFLGSGKTTLLQRVLNNKDGVKCAVIVNDLASVNVDANVIGKDMKVSGAAGICGTVQDHVSSAFLARVPRLFSRVVVPSVCSPSINRSMPAAGSSYRVRQSIALKHLWALRIR